MVRNLLFMFLVLIGGLPPIAADDPVLTVKQDDVWVIAGDSITAQRLHSNYIEAFYRTRYPDLNLRFRNSGIGGNRTSSILARFDYDVAAWKPTVVSIELGMNDVGSGDDPQRYIDGKPAATVTEKEFASAWNMATVYEGAIAERSATSKGRSNGETT